MRILRAAVLLLGLLSPSALASTPKPKPVAACRCTCGGQPVPTNTSITWPSCATPSKPSKSPKPVPAPAPAPTTDLPKPLAPTPAPTPVPDQYVDVLARTNALRSVHDAPALAWSPEAAASADAWLARCEFEHENQTWWGENLYALWGTDDEAAALVAAVDSWYDEGLDYRFDVPGFSRATGHFTALVWRETREVGCGAQSCGPVVLVACRYSPPGNLEGGFVANVLPATPVAGP